MQPEPAAQSNPNSNQTRVTRPQLNAQSAFLLSSDTIPHFSFTLVKFPPNLLYLQISRRRQSLGVTRKPGQLSLPECFTTRPAGQTGLRADSAAQAGGAVVQ